MNAVTAFGDDPANLLDAHFAGVIVFGGTTRGEARTDDGEDDRLEMVSVIWREGTVDENVPKIHPACLPARARATASRNSFCVKWVAFPLGFRMRTPS